MPMKISLALGPRQPLSRQTAWGCLTSNLALPGSGSLLAGRRSGYSQLVLAMAGLLVITIFGLRFILWALGNWSRLHAPDADPVESLLEIWVHLKWALLGFGVALIAWLWALITGLSILNSAPKTDHSSSPPRLT